MLFLISYRWLLDMKLAPDQFTTHADYNFICKLSPCNVINASWSESMLWSKIMTSILIFALTVKNISDLKKEINKSLVVNYRERVVSPYGASTYCLFPGCIITWAWSLAKGQYMVSWLLTSDWRPPPPQQRYWQNRETANIGLVSSVGRAPARQSGGHRFKSRSSKFFFVHPKCI